MESNNVLVYGTGGFGREVAWLLREVIDGLAVFRGSDCSIPQLTAFLDDDAAKAGTVIHGLPVFTPDDAARRYPGAEYVVAVGNPATRAQLAARAGALGFRPAPATVHPGVPGDWPRVIVGRGSVVAAGCTVTTDITIGAHAHVNLDCTIGHDVRIADLVTIAPGVHLSGHVTVEQGAEIGTGAVVRQGVTIGAGAVVGMGAVVLRDVPPGETWVGSPARKLR